MASCGAELEANRLILALTQDATFDIPDIDFNDPDFKFPPGLMDQPVTPLRIEDVTDGNILGAGAFDALMRGFKAHLAQEFDEGRITGNDYTKAYIALTESAMAQGMSFVLGKDAAFWQAQSAKLAAYTARMQLEVAKAQMASMQFEAANQKAGYALTKMKIGTEEVTYCTGVYNLEQMLPKQFENLDLQGKMVKEQTEGQRAQTLDTRTDGQAVKGSVGKQKELYSQQITSYQRNAEVAAAKIFSDAWITQKTLDDGLLAPEVFQNSSVNTVLSRVRANNGLDS